MKSLPFFSPGVVRKRIRFGFVIAVFLIASGFLLTLLSYIQYGRYSEEIDRSNALTIRVAKLLALMVDVETGVRGYAATEDRIYLEPYQRAIVRIPDELKQLQVQAGRDERLYKHVDTLVRQANEEVQFAHRLIESVKERDPASVTQSYMLVGKVRMDRLRAQIARMTAEEYGRRQNLTRQAGNSYRYTVIILFVLSLLTFIALVVSYNLLSNELNTREQTERQLLTFEQELKEKIRLLEISNEELERFAFVASHDMQEPLRKIQSFGFLLRDRFELQLAEEGKNYLAKMLQSAERMSKMIKDLLNFSRISNKQEPFRPVPLKEVVLGILSDQELKIKTMGADIQLGDLPVVEAVPSQMDHLFNNLLSNALKFTRPGEKPVITVASERVDGGLFEELIPGKSYCKVSIADNGIGFDEKYLDHIFKIFQRLHGKSTYEGTGIGLAICKRIVSYHKGVITARSMPGEGACFIVVLPENQTQPKHDTTAVHETHSHLIG